MKRKEKTLATWILGAIVLSCAVTAVISMAIGMSIYGTGLSEQYIDTAFGVAQHASYSVLHGQPRTEGLAAQVMDIYNSLTEEQKRKAVSSDPAEREEYRSYYSSINTELKTGEIYDVLYHMLPGYMLGVDYVYIGMYDAETNRLVYIVDSDQNPETQMLLGEWEYVSPKEAQSFLNYDYKSGERLYHLSRTPEYGLICTAGFPIQYVKGTTSCFLLVDVKMTKVTQAIREYALKTGFPLLIATALMAWIISKLVRRNVVKPINDITIAAQRYVRDRRDGKGITDHFSALNIQTGDELETLSHTMADMEQKLYQHEEYITRITAETERINAELDTAKSIQESQLPNVFPPYPNRPEFDIYAMMNPAKEVGGDFYDFFMTDNDHLCLVIADVSGKGVPAALFMMISKILIKTRIQNGDTPGEALANVNNQLQEGGETDMFVTVWLCVLDIRTGEARISNAGHEHPAVCRKGGKYELVTYRHSPALGMMEDMVFEEHGFQLHPGDTLFVYTDGVPEATNKDSKMFGTDRMLDALNKEPGANSKQLLANVRDAVNVFVGDAEQFDDLTMLCLEYKA